MMDWRHLLPAELRLHLNGYYLYNKGWMLGGWQMDTFHLLSLGLEFQWVQHPRKFPRVDLWPWTYSIEIYVSRPSSDSNLLWVVAQAVKSSAVQPRRFQLLYEWKPSIHGVILPGGTIHFGRHERAA
jgi:hypothetical protein